jgi:hypothetical protein
MSRVSGAAQIFKIETRSINAERLPNAQYRKDCLSITDHILTFKTKPDVAILQPIMNKVPIKIIVAANICAYK